MVEAVTRSKACAAARTETTMVEEASSVTDIEVQQRIETMTNMTNEQRQDFLRAWEALDARDAAIMAARKPIDEQLRPFLCQSMEVEEEREALIDKAGAEFLGKCQQCDKALFEGDQGSRPYQDEPGIIFCAEHGMTYADLQRSWSDIPESEDDWDQAERRKGALEMVQSHVARGGALIDLVPPYTL